MVKIIYTGQTANEVLKHVKEKGLSLERTIRIRKKLHYFGHLIRKDKMLLLFLERKVFAKRYQYFVGCPQKM